MGVSITGVAGLLSVLVPMVNPKSVIVRASADHAIHVEYGTSRQPAQPFARPGTAKVVGRIGDMVTQANTLPALVDKIAEDIAKEWRELAPVDTGELRESIEVIHG